MMTYAIVIISFTLGFMFSALFARKEDCASCSGRQGVEKAQENLLK